jgi:inhibitor of KinA
MIYPHSYTIYPLGDSAATIDLGPAISPVLNDTALAMQDWIITHRFNGYKDCIAAYSSVTVWYNPLTVKKAYPTASTAFEWVKEQLEEAYRNSSPRFTEANDTIIKIPVCYNREFGTDIDAVLTTKGITEEELIQLHTSRVYRVYMIGFLPGFPYMAEVDENIRMPRKQEPVTVKKGSVGITGMQTGIYPFESQGGWQIIGRTPLSLFDATKQLKPSLLKAGDQVQCVAISKDSFENGDWL